MNIVRYRRLIKEKIRRYAFQHLIKKQKNGSKGVEIDYGKYLQTQPYLLPNEILNINNQIKLFSYRCRMNIRNYNFPSDKKEEICLCGKYVLTNEHLYHCNILRSDLNIEYPEYSKLFNGDIYEQKIIVNIMEENEEKYHTLSQRSTMEP